MKNEYKKKTHINDLHIVLNEELLSTPLFTNVLLQRHVALNAEEISVIISLLLYKQYQIHCSRAV